MMRLFHRVPIRWRLAGGSAVLTFVILATFALLVGHLTTTRIRTDFNDQTARAADELRDSVVARYNAEDGTVEFIRPNLQFYATADNAVIRVLTQDGTRVRSFPKRTPDFGIQTDGGIDVKGFRVETRSFALPLGGFILIQYARRLADVNATVDRVQFFLFTGVLAGAALRPAGRVCWWRATRCGPSDGSPTRRARSRGRATPTAASRCPEATDEVAELARTLDEMLLALESSRAETAETLQRQRQFVADASHELRTPLTSVLANLELLAEVLDGERGEAAQSRPALLAPDAPARRRPAAARPRRRRPSGPPRPHRCVAGGRRGCRRARAGRGGSRAVGARGPCRRWCPARATNSTAWC